MFTLYITGNHFPPSMYQLIHECQYVFNLQRCETCLSQGIYHSKQYKYDKNVTLTTMKADVMFTVTDDLQGNSIDFKHQSMFIDLGKYLNKHEHKCK